MFLSSSSSVVKENYHAPPIGDEEQQNMSVCIGTFSGASSSYNMYKSNCFDLMVNSCSTKWTPECDAYIANSSNTKQTELFLNTVASYGKQPVSSTNSCNVSGHSHNANQRIVMGMNTFQTDDETYVPLSCYQSTFLEQKKRNLIKKQEFEERKRAQRMAHELQFKKQLQLERIRIDKKENSISLPEVSVSTSPEVLVNTPQDVNHTKTESVLNSTGQKKSFYDSITDVSNTPCSKTCEITKIM